jgi:ornithine cyclodeaminase/alanine dehydrogenase-like protein (mu-crystallin family)
VATNAAPLLYLSRADVERVGLTMAEVIEAVETALREKGHGRAENPPKPGIHTQPDAFIHAMPAFVPALGAAGIKWVGGYPGNPEKGLPYISGLIVLNDPETGLPTAVLDASWVTAVRTGAATAVSAKFLARPDAQVLAILGCGVQGRSNLRALREVLPRLSLVQAYDTNTEALHAYAREMEQETGLDIRPMDCPEAAVRGADVVVTAGPIRKDPRPAIEAAWLKEGVFAAPLDFDSYFSYEAMAACDLFCTDDRAQLAYYQSQGRVGPTPPVWADLGEILSGRRPGRTRADERTMTMNLGLAIEDVAVAVRMAERARAAGIGMTLPS